MHNEKSKNLHIWLGLTLVEQVIRIPIVVFGYLAILASSLTVPPPITYIWSDYLFPPDRFWLLFGAFTPLLFEIIDLLRRNSWDQPYHSKSQSSAIGIGKSTIFFFLPLILVGAIAQTIFEGSEFAYYMNGVFQSALATFSGSMMVFCFMYVPIMLWMDKNK